MVLIILRALFVLALAAVGMSFAKTATAPGGLFSADFVLIGCIGMALMVIALDIFVPQKSLAAMSGLFFGLMVGMIVAYGLSLIVDLGVESLMPGDEGTSMARLVKGIKLGLGVICCYLAISFVLQTKDDVRFVIPYVEFSKQTKGARPLLLDTSVIIDGRIADIADTRIVESEMIVPRFVLLELQSVADSADKLKRNRGRRGLDMLNKMRLNEKITIKILDVEVTRDDAQRGVDELLLETAKLMNGRVVTNDYNLNKLAQLRGVEVININDLANAMKPVVLPGETMTVKVVKQGEEIGQGIGYLEDGTMVVAEGGRDKIGQTITITVTSVLQTSAGRMIFGRLEGVGTERRRPTRPSRPSTSETMNG